MEGNQDRKKTDQEYRDFCKEKQAQMREHKIRQDAYRKEVQIQAMQDKTVKLAENIWNKEVEFT